jgi:hypothetical protein
MSTEGFVMLQHCGRYAIYGREIYHELSSGDRKISFYPMMVYARLISKSGEENRET